MRRFGLEPWLESDTPVELGWLDGVREPRDVGKLRYIRKFWGVDVGVSKRCGAL